jgi:twitching motility protein PilT
MNFDKILRVAVNGNASDVILKTGSLPRFRHRGQLISLSDGEIITSETMKQWIEQIVPKHLHQTFEENGDIDFGYESTFGHRFRVNLFKHRQKQGMVLRVISNHVKTLEELQLPAVIKRLALSKRGLILVTGSTGSGKSTTLAAMIQKINQERSANIVTIEDPIEYIFTEDKSTIIQRELGIDVNSFENALRAALRQSPDVIFLGELRDKESTETALKAAETGHLVLSTLHTGNSIESLNRLISYFQPHQHNSIRSQLSNTLQGIISQRLVRKINGKGMIPAIEILVANARVKECIRDTEHNFAELSDAIKHGQKSYGMQSFDYSLFELYRSKKISQEEALENASARDNLKLMMQGVGAA